MTSVLKVDNIQNSSGTSALEIDSNGYVKIPQYSGFHVRLNNTDTTNRSSQTAVIPDWTVDNDGINSVGTYNSGEFDLTNGYYTTPVDGIYDFSASIRVDGFGGTFLELYLVINADESTPAATNTNRIYYHIESATASDYTTVSLSVNSAKLDAGEKVGLVLFSSGDTTTTLATKSYFSGKLVTRI